MKQFSLELMREFYANVLDKGGHTVMIREIPVSFSPDDINTSYGLKVVDMEEFDHMEHVRSLNKAQIARMCPTRV